MGRPGVYIHENGCGNGNPSVFLGKLPDTGLSDTGCRIKPAIIA